MSGRTEGGAVPPTYLARWAAKALLLVILLLLSPLPALAHATLISSNPVDGSVIAATPADVTLQFNEPVSPTDLKLVTPAGAITPLSDARAENASIVVPLPPLEHGTHLVSWRAVSADGHPVGGSLVFSVGAPSQGALPTLPDGLGDSERAAMWLSRLASYLGLFLGVGGAFFLAIIAPEARARWTSMPFVAVGLLALPMALALQGLDALGSTLGSVLDPAAWRAGFATSYGATAAIAFAALLLAAGSLCVRPVPLRRSLATVALLGVGSALAASGHASAAAPQGLMCPAVFLHAVSIAFWIGALMPLGMLLAGRDPGAGVALRRFSAVIPLVVAALAISGATIAVVQVEQPAALASTRYGQILLAKLALVAVLLGMAAYNRWELTKPAAQGSQTASKGLGRSALIEAGLAAVILALAAGWRFTPPPRVLAIEAAKPAFTHIHIGTAMADVSVAPGRVGEVEVLVFPMHPDMRPLEAKEVIVEFSLPEAGVEPLRRKAERIETGGWTAELALPLPGAWTVKLEVMVSDFDKVTMDAPVEIRP
ncbi:MAG: copper resistance protein CopC [Rhizobiaceae bacterium]